MKLAGTVTLAEWDTRPREIVPPPKSPGVTLSNMDYWVPWTTYVDFLVRLVLITSLVRNGLFRIYRFFFLYLAADAAETLVLIVFQTHLNTYARLYFAGQFVKF